MESGQSSACTSTFSEVSTHERMVTLAEFALRDVRAVGQIDDGTRVHGRNDHADKVEDKF